MIPRALLLRSKGLIRRTLSMVEARRRQGVVNHVGGRCTFLALRPDRARSVLSIHGCALVERAGWLKQWIYCGCGCVYACAEPA